MSARARRAALQAAAKAGGEGKAPASQQQGQGGKDKCSAKRALAAPPPPAASSATKRARTGKGGGGTASTGPTSKAPGSEAGGGKGKGKGAIAGRRQRGAVAPTTTSAKAVATAAARAPSGRKDGRQGRESKADMAALNEARKELAALTGSPAVDDDMMRESVPMNAQSRRKSKPQQKQQEGVGGAVEEEQRERSLLEAMFEELESAICIFRQRRHACLFASRLKPAVEIALARRFGDEHLSRITGVFPAAYKLSWVETAPAAGKGTATTGGAFDILVEMRDLAPVEQSSSSTNSSSSNGADGGGGAGEPGGGGAPAKGVVGTRRRRFSSLLKEASRKHCTCTTRQGQRESKGKGTASGAGGGGDEVCQDGSCLPLAPLPLPPAPKQQERPRTKQSPAVTGGGGGTAVSPTGGRVGGMAGLRERLRAREAREKSKSERSEAEVEEELNRQADLVGLADMVRLYFRAGPTSNVGTGGSAVLDTLATDLARTSRAPSSREHMRGRLERLCAVVPDWCCITQSGAVGGTPGGGGAGRPESSAAIFSLQRSVDYKAIREMIHFMVQGTC